jgi:outer membrane cobalamin receptor
VIDARTLEISRASSGARRAAERTGHVRVQTGVRGGTASLFVRRWRGNFNKVLVDDVPVNDIGGAFDFAQLSTTGIDRIEVLRQTNSVMYGTDALCRRDRHDDETRADAPA